MWTLEPQDIYIKRCKKWRKRHAREFERVHLRLQQVLDSLNRGANPTKLPLGFLHSEPQGVLAIEQGDSSLKETRLYIYAYAKSEQLYVITIGDKNTQSADIAYCKEVVKEILGPDYSR